MLPALFQWRRQLEVSPSTTKVPWPHGMADHQNERDRRRGQDKSSNFHFTDRLEGFFHGLYSFKFERTCGAAVRPPEILTYRFRANSESERKRLHWGRIQRHLAGTVPARIRNLQHFAE
jgi:hypothetical protein